MENISTQEQLEYSIDKHVGQRVKHRRIVLGLTRQQVANVANVSVQQMHKYETAINRISSSKLYNLAVFFKVPVSYFFEMLDVSGIVSSSTLSEENDGFNIGYDINILSEVETVRLVKAYSKIKSKDSRKKILELIDTMGDRNGTLKIVTNV